MRIPAKPCRLREQIIVIIRFVQNYTLSAHPSCPLYESTLTSYVVHPFAPFRDPP